jgi:cysteate synthase
VAVACLRDAVADGTVPRDAKVLLNITGGGRRRLAADVDLRPAEPVTVVSVADHEAGVLPPVAWWTAARPRLT